MQVTMKRHVGETLSLQGIKKVTDDDADDNNNFITTIINQ